MSFKFLPLATERVEGFWAGQLDDNGQKPEMLVSDGGGNPCRHCLKDIPEGREMLVLAFRSEEKINPYAEVGPIFLCADRCERHQSQSSLPDLFKSRESLLIRGYSSEGRIVYGTGSVVDVSRIEVVATELFKDESVEYIHLRSSSNNCYQCKIER